MYRPSTVKRHNESLRRFQDYFNKEEPKDVIMCVWAEISKLNDGIIILVSGKYFGQYPYIVFDWEWREDWEISNGKCKFHYPTLGQFGRKFDKEKGIELTIQCDKSEKCFVVAWHKDFGPWRLVRRKTNSIEKETGFMRETSRFKIYSYKEIPKFKKALKLALIKNIRDFSVFEEVNESE